MKLEKAYNGSQGKKWSSAPNATKQKRTNNEMSQGD